MNVQELEKQLAELEAQKVALFDGGNADQVAVSRINAQIRDVQAQLNDASSMVQKEQIEQKQVEHSGGLKENLRSILESIMPKEAFTKIIGLTEYEEMQQLYNQMVDVSVDESNAALYEHFGQQLEAKDVKIQELTTRAISLDADLQEARQKEDQAWVEAEEAERKYTEEADKNRQLEAKQREMADEITSKEREIEGLNGVIKVKDDENNELRKQLNEAPAPRSGFIDVTPGPSAKLEELRNAASKKSLTNFERVLSGEAPFRGKVIIGADEQPLTVPSFGGSESTNSFRDGTETEPSNGGIQDCESIAVPATVDEPFRTEENATGELAEHEPVQPDDGEGYVTRAEFEAFKQEVESKIAAVVGDVEAA